LGSLQGRIRSVHRAAIHAELARPDDLLVVALADVGGIPGGLLVEGATDLRTVGVEPGMALTATPEGLAIPAAGVAIDVARARSWSPALPAAARLTPAALTAGSIAPARALAARRAPTGGLGPLLSGDARSDDPWLDAARLRIERQLWAFGAGDMASVLGEAVELIGLGPGLTPSGDDYLVGLLAGLEAAGHLAHPALATAVGHAAPGRTTAIGASMLAHAAHGHYAERLHDVLAAIGAGRIDGLARPIERAMAYGATSGADTLVGLFAAIGIASAGSAGRAGPADPARTGTSSGVAA
jgi:uncharacterized protein DUF2877